MDGRGRLCSSSAASCSRTPGGCGARRGRDRARRGDAAPLVIVHGGGKEIDAALQRAGHREAAGRRPAHHRRRRRSTSSSRCWRARSTRGSSRRSCAAGGAGGRADRRRRGAGGWSSVRRRIGRSTAPRSISGASGTPTGAVGAGARCSTSWADGYVPVVACIGMGADGALFNVNADTLAAHLAARLRRATASSSRAARPGVLDETGATIARLDAGAVERAHRVRGGERGDGREAAGLPGCARPRAWTKWC